MQSVQDGVGVSGIEGGCMSERVGGHGGMGYQLLGLRGWRVGLAAWVGEVGGRDMLGVCCCGMGMVSRKACCCAHRAMLSYVTGLSRYSVAACKATLFGVTLFRTH